MLGAATQAGEGQGAQVGAGAKQAASRRNSAHADNKFQQGALKRAKTSLHAGQTCSTSKFFVAHVFDAVGTNLEE